MVAHRNVCIRKIVNRHFNSNTFVVLNEYCSEVTIIDPGDAECLSLLEVLADYKAEKLNIILTHEHYDHISGLQKLCSMYKTYLYSSDKCYKNLNDPKLNLSEYLDIYIMDSIRPSFIKIVRDGDVIKIGDLYYTFYETPGHSEGSICFGFNDVLFTGDTILPMKVPTNFPGGSKAKLIASIQRLRQILTSYERILPGHGEPYSVELKEIKPSE